jgi:type II secretory pathway pseudopilin PulG
MEVVVSISIATLFAATTLQGLTIALILSAKSRQTNAAERLVNNDLEEIRLIATSPPTDTNCDRSPTITTGLAAKVRDRLESTPLPTTSATDNSPNFLISRTFNTIDEPPYDILGVRYRVQIDNPTTQPVVDLYTEMTIDPPTNCK